MKFFTPFTSVVIISMIATTGMIASPQVASAYHKTNKWEVKRNLENGWTVMYAKEFNHDEYLKLASAIALDVSGGSGGVTATYFTTLALDSLKQIQAQASKTPDIARVLSEQLTTNRLLSAIRGSFKGGVIDLSVAGVDIEVGNATYNRAECAKVPAPTLRKPGRTVEKCMPTPNTHQPYIRFRVKQ